MEGDERFRFTWHWPAFFVTFGWMMYRKLYGWAILALFSQFIPLVQLFAPILWPLTANYIYYRHAKKKLIEIKRSCQSSETQKDVIAASGGVSFTALAIAAAVAIVFIGIMGAIAVPAYLDSVRRNCLYSVVRSVVSVKTAVVAAAKGILKESDEAYNRTVWLDPAVELEKKGLERVARLVPEMDEKRSRER